MPKRRAVHIMRRGEQFAHTWSAPGRKLYKQAIAEGWQTIAIIQGDDMLVAHGTRPLSHVMQVEQAERERQTEITRKERSRWYELDKARHVPGEGAYVYCSSPAELLEIVCWAGGHLLQESVLGPSPVGSLAWAQAMARAGWWVSVVPIAGEAVAPRRWSPPKQRYEHQAFYGGWIPDDRMLGGDDDTTVWEICLEQPGGKAGSIGSLEWAQALAKSGV